MGETVTGPGPVDRSNCVRYLDLINSVSRPMPPMPVADLGPPALSALGGPMARARVMLLGSARVHLREDPPFAPVTI